MDGREVKDVDRLAYDQMREELADLEHEQWVHWTEYMLANLTPENIARWKGQCLRGYSALTEREKESDRSWADRVLEIIATYTMMDDETFEIINMDRDRDRDHQPRADSRSGVQVTIGRAIYHSSPED